MKFIFILACFLVALGSFFICKNKRDWFLLSLALGFTLVADFFLILHDWHLPGVAVFCFAHIAYIMRAISQGQESNRQITAFAMPGVFVVIAIGLALIRVDAIFVVSGLYAVLFISNIIVSTRYLQHNRRLVITGLLLFLACDVCVLIFNLPVYFDAPGWLTGVFPLIWVFYLPSQVLLSISGVDFSRFKRD